MALSNWDCLKEFSGDEELIAQLKPIIEVYKNWINLHLPGGCVLHATPKEFYQNDNGESSFSNLRFRILPTPSLCSLSSEEYHTEADKIPSCEISIYRGPQNGVFFVAAVEDFIPDIPRRAIGAGCGVYGYNESKWIGVNNESIEYLRHLIGSQYMSYPTAEILEKISGAMRYNQGDAK